MCVCVCMCRFVCVYTDESMHGSSWHAVLRPQAPTKSLPSGATVNRRTAICTRRRSLSARCPPVSCSSHVHWMRWIRYTRCGWLCVYVCVCVCVCVPPVCIILHLPIISALPNCLSLIRVCSLFQQFSSDPPSPHPCIKNSSKCVTRRSSRPTMPTFESQVTLDTSSTLFHFTTSHHAATLLIYLCTDECMTHPLITIYCHRSTRVPVRPQEGTGLRQGS